MRTPWIAGLLMLMMSGVALAKKKKGDEPAAAEAPAEEVKPDVPADKNSEKFAEGLLALTITNFIPLSTSSSAKFRYDTLQFMPDNTWKGVGFVEVFEERMDCTEAGTWSMEPAESSTVATMTWKVEKTDCPNQDSGSERRYLITLEKDGISAAYR